MNFFIFSLPRSGSAWLSMFLTGKDSFCYHDPSADMDEDELRIRMSRRPEKVVGAVDTGAYVRATDIRSEYRCFRLYREPVEIRRSSLQFGVDYPAEAESRKLYALESLAGMTRIEYSGFQDILYLEHLWDEIVGTEFDAERARVFQEMTIERDIAKFFNQRPQLCISASYPSRSM